MFPEEVQGVPISEYLRKEEKPGMDHPPETLYAPEWEPVRI